MWGALNYCKIYGIDCWCYSARKRFNSA